MVVEVLIKKGIAESVDGTMPQRPYNFTERHIR